MNIGFLDCFSGVSGDMWVGALVDLGLPLQSLEGAVASLDLPGVEISAEKVLRAGMAGTRFLVQVVETGSHRHLGDILAILQRAELPDAVQARCREVFELLADAEARVHGSTREAVHFHEVGGEDTIVDVVCACLGTHLLNLDVLYSSAVVTGKGTVDCEHGVMPVPAPGAMGNLFGIPLRSGGPDVECVTPTGAALLKTLVHTFEPQLTWTPERAGYGAGTRDNPGHPNLLRLTRGVLQRAAGETQLWEIACNLDTATGETLAYLIEAALQRGAADAFATPIHMKKGRPGHQLNALVDEAHREDLTRFLLEESSTLGLRMHRVERQVLERWEETRHTSLGPVRFKVARLPSGHTLARPEDDELLRLGREHGLSRQELRRRLLGWQDPPDSSTPG